MCVNITPSLIAGTMQQEMWIKVCNNYHFSFNTNNKKLESYSFIKREDCTLTQSYPHERETVSSVYGYDVCDGCKKFFYKDDQLPLQYYFVENSIIPGVVGIKRQIGNSRIMVASGALSGCGFAILFFNKCIYIIHAGASGSQSANTDNNRQQNRWRINRDIYFMAYALRYGSEEYETMLNTESGIKFKNAGIDKTILFDLFKKMDFDPFCISVPDDCYQYIVGTPDLYLQTYNPRKWLHDVICVSNEYGKTHLVVRALDGVKGNIIAKAWEYLFYLF